MEEKRRSRRHQEQVEMQTTMSRRQNKILDEEGKEKRLKRRLDITILILSALIVLTLLFMRYVNF